MWWKKFVDGVSYSICICIHRRRIIRIGCMVRWEMNRVGWISSGRSVGILWLLSRILEVVYICVCMCCCCCQWWLNAGLPEEDSNSRTNSRREDYRIYIRGSLIPLTSTSTSQVYIHTLLYIKYIYRWNNDGNGIDARSTVRERKRGRGRERERIGNKGK